MLIEQPPQIYRLFFPGAYWRIPAFEGKPKSVYLTFDDGPTPEMTPWIIEVLDKYRIKATFFCVGENVLQFPILYSKLIDNGHRVGNHTFNHLQGIRCLSKNYVRNIAEATKYIDSDLFRPPHGHMRLPQLIRLRKIFRIIMWDVVTRDYNPHLKSNDVFNNIKRYTRNGSIIVFHDSLKAKGRIEQALPQAIEWLLNEGYQFCIFD